MVIRNIKWTEIIDNESEINKKSAFYVIPLDAVTCKLVVVDDLGVTREISSGSGGAADRYVTGVSFSTTSGDLTLTRSSGLIPLTANLDGRYIRGNQTISLQDEIIGTGSTTISTTAKAPIITNRPVSNLLDNNSAFLYYDSSTNELAQLKWATVSTYIDSKVYNPPTQPVIDVEGTGLNFVQKVKVDILGHTTEVALGTIPDATQDDKGVVKKSKPEDLVDTNTTDVVTPADVLQLISGNQARIINEDDTLIITNDSILNTYFINANASTINEEFIGVQNITLGFTPTNLLGVYLKGIRLNSNEFNIVLPNQINIIPTVGSTDSVILTYQHLIV
jgi:hypothetical protein